MFDRPIVRLFSILGAFISRLNNENLEIKQEKLGINGS